MSFEVRNPITNAAALAIDGDRYPAQRFEELWMYWVMGRFDGSPLAIDAKGGGTEIVEFYDCGVMWGENPPTADRKPLIHLLMVDHTEEDESLVPGQVGKRHDWIFQAVVKLDRNLTGTPHPARPEFIVRKIASDFAMLLGGPEKLALSVLGVEKIKVESGPIQMPTSRWAAETVVVSATTRQNLARLG